MNISYIIILVVSTKKECGCIHGLAPADTSSHNRMLLYEFAKTCVVTIAIFTEKKLVGTKGSCWCHIVFDGVFESERAR